MARDGHWTEPTVSIVLGISAPYEAHQSRSIPFGSAPAANRIAIFSASGPSRGTRHVGVGRVVVFRFDGIGLK